MSWRNWERTEQRCRYYEGSFKVSTDADLPEGLPEKAETFIEYDHLCDPEIYDHIANHRLNDRMVQTFQEMLLQTNVEAKASGVAKPIGLPPAAFVSTQEAHADVSLCEALGYSIVDDQETPGGLRLIEWVRGYAVLQQISEERYAKDGKDGLCFALSRAVLIATLERTGLKDGTAERFIDLASLQSSSRDLYDQPLVRMRDNRTGMAHAESSQYSTVGRTASARRQTRRPHLGMRSPEYLIQGLAI